MSDEGWNPMRSNRPSLNLLIIKEPVMKVKTTEVNIVKVETVEHPPRIVSVLVPDRKGSQRRIAVVSRDVTIKLPILAYVKKKVTIETRP